MEDIEEIKKTLAKYNSNFAAMKFVKCKTKSEVGNIIRKLEEECNESFENGLERNTAQNLLSFLYYMNGDEKKALDLNAKVQNEDATNITALCNKAWILCRSQQFAECQRFIEILKNLENNALSRLMSKAEVAYTCARLGMHAYEEAIKIYTEVKKECEEFGNTYDMNSEQQVAANSKPINAIATEKKCFWTYGMALTFRRTLHLLRHSNDSSIDISKHQYARILQLFYEVVSMQESNSLIDRCRGRAYVEIGNVIYGIEKYTPTYFKGVKDIVPENSQLHQSAEYFYKMGLKTCPEDSFVLQKVGVHCRYIKQIQDSIKHLEKAVSIKKSSYAYHHLGLSLQRQILLEQCRNKRGQRDAHFRSAYQCGNLSKSFPKMSLKENRVPGNHFEKPKIQAMPTDALSFANTCYISSKYQLQTQSSCNESTHIPTARHTPVANLIKSPRQPVYINAAEHGETISRIFECFDKAFELADKNYDALYDKGLLHRHLKQNKEALQVFLSLICTIKERHYSLILLANAYEQAAFCILDMETGDEQRTKTNARIYLKIAIEIACDVVVKVPFLDNSWQGLPTFSSIVSGEPKSKQILKDLPFLCQKLENLKNDIDILKELKAIEQDDKEKLQISMKIVKDYVLIENYDEAIFALNVMKCYGYSAVDKTLYLTVHIDGGIEAYKRKDKNLASLRFLKALLFERKSGFEQHMTNEDTNDFEYNADFDIYVTCLVEAEKTAQKLIAVLDDMGLRATLNDNDVLPGILKLKGMFNIMKASTHFIILIDSSMTNLSGNVKYAVDAIVDVIKDRKYGNVLVVKTMPNVEVPEMISKTFRAIDFFEITMQSTSDEPNHSTLQKLKDILFLLSSNDRCTALQDEPLFKKEDSVYVAEK